MLAVCGLAATVALTAAACGDSDVTGPGNGTNTPPVIQSLTAGSAQVDGEQSVQLTAVVADQETTPAQLTYQWSATPSNGTFTGSGAQVRWRPPSTAPVPSEFTITLTVVESYFSGANTKENRVATSTDVRYNELIVQGLVNQFLTDFGTFSKTPQECVRNFSDNCSGKSAELSDIAGNRARSGVQIESASFPPASVSLRASGVVADASAPCTFVDRNSNGTRVAVAGTCDLTAVYEAPRWLLCTSNFNPPFTTTPLGGALQSMPRAPAASFTDPALLPRFSHP
jgi:hypothetical protein